MTYRTLSLGLLVTAIGTMAFASSANATLGYLINLKSALHASVTGTQEGLGYLLIAALGLEIMCEEFTVETGLITSATHAEGKLLYKGCKPLVMGGLEEFTACKILDATGAAHITATALLLPAEILTTQAPAILAEKINALVLIHHADPVKQECVLPENNAVAGELCLTLIGNNSKTPLVKASNTIQGTCKPRKALEGLQDEMASGTNFKDKLLYGAQTAHVDGSATLLLIGEHNDMELGVTLF